MTVLTSAQAAAMVDAYLSRLRSRRRGLSALDPLWFVRSLTQIDKSLIVDWTTDRRNVVFDADGNVVAAAGTIADKDAVRAQLASVLRARGGGRYWDPEYQDWTVVAGPNTAAGSPTLGSPSWSVPVGGPTYSFDPSSPAYTGVGNSTITFNTPSGAVTVANGVVSSGAGSGAGTGTGGGGGQGASTPLLLPLTGSGFGGAGLMLGLGLGAAALGLMAFKR
jgi:hypothetical protein